MTTTINASTSNGIVQTADGSGVMKLQSNGVTTNALAWVNFNGTTSPGTIRSQYNVSSVTKNGTGDYTINLTNATTDANLVVTGWARVSGSGGTLAGVNDTALSTSTVRVGSLNVLGVFADALYVTVAIFGN